MAITNVSVVDVGTIYTFGYRAEDGQTYSARCLIDAYLNSRVIERPPTTVGGAWRRVWGGDYGGPPRGGAGWDTQRFAAWVAATMEQVIGQAPQPTDPLANVTIRDIATLWSFDWTYVGQPSPMASRAYINSERDQAFIEIRDSQGDWRRRSSGMYLGPRRNGPGWDAQRFAAWVEAELEQVTGEVAAP